MRPVCTAVHAEELWRPETTVAAWTESGSLILPLWTYYDSAREVVVMTGALTSAGLYNISVRHDPLFP